MRRIIAMAIILGCDFRRSGPGRVQRNQAPLRQRESGSSATPRAASQRRGGSASSPSRTQGSVAPRRMDRLLPDTPVINVRLNKLKTAVNNAQAHVNALDACLGIQGMTSYGEDPNGGSFGFVWRDDTVPEEFLTTSLDCDNLNLADIWAVVRLC